MKRFLILFIGLSLLMGRTLLTNVNSAEWGDSYRILRASNFVQQLSYPQDEKRPPLFSALLAIRPSGVDAVLWGRIFMLGLTFASMYVFYKLSGKWGLGPEARLLSCVFLLLNPVFLYWSLRVYADLLFTLLTMLCFYVFELWREKRSVGYVLLMGFICGLGILTRFEGYLLTLATFIGIGVAERKRAYIMASAALAVTLPWLIYRNPLTSSYFEETTGRKYDLVMVLTYVISYLYVLGIIPAVALISQLLYKSLASLPKAIKSYPHVAAFVVLESLLILAWPAAVPRLFLPVIPFLVILFVKSTDSYFKNGRNSLRAATTAATLIFIYAVLQSRLRLQFLGPHTAILVGVVSTSLVAAASMAFRKRRLFILTAAISTMLLSASTIYLHKDVYRTIKEIAVFSLRETNGKYIYNDTSGICDWYLKGQYRDLNNKMYLTQENLLENQVDYVVITNEHNVNLDIDLSKRPYLSLIKASQHTAGGKMFFTWLIKVNK